jgi:hypothetical protein
MSQRIRIGLAGMGRVRRIHAASRSGPYTVKQENR